MPSRFCSRLRLAGLVLLTTLLAGPALRAQTYTPLTHSGELNRDFTRSAVSRYTSKASRTKGKNRDQRQERDSRNAYALQTALALNAQHRSGQILSNDWVSAHVRTLGERVAVAAGRKPGDVRFYVIASPAVNAFATGDETVYVTMGLLSRLTSEAQLAFVLAHELGHVELNHNFDLYIKADEIARESTTRAGRRASAEDPFAVNRYSRENETAADDFGYTIYKQLGYPAAEAESAFEILRRSYLTFDEHDFTPADVAVYDFNAPAAWTLPELVEPLSLRERREAAEAEDAAREAERAETASRRGRRGRGRNTDDTAETTGPEEAPDGTTDDNPSTHPALEERLGKAREKLAGLEGGESYVVWRPSTLDSIRRQARYEVIDYALRDADYQTAIFEATALLKSDAEPDSTFLHKAIAQSVLAQAVFRQAYGDIREELERELKEAPKSRRFVFEKRLKEFDEDAKFPTAENAYGELQRVYFYGAEAEVRDLADLALAQAIRLEIERPKSPSARAFTDRALELLVDLDGGDAERDWAKRLPDAAAAATAARLDLPRRAKDAKQYADLVAYNKADVDRREAQSKRGAALGASSILVAMPSFRASYQADADDLRRSEDGGVNQVKLLKTAMDEVGLRGQILSDRLRKDDSADLNEVRTAREFVLQFMQLEPFRLVPHNYDALMDLVEKDKAEKLVYLFETQSEKTSVGAMSLGALYGIFLSPYTTVASFVKRPIAGNIFTLVIDPKLRQIDHTDSFWYYNGQSATLQHANYYALFHQVHQRAQ